MPFRFLVQAHLCDYGNSGMDEECQQYNSVFQMMNEIPASMCVQRDIVMLLR